MTIFMFRRGVARGIATATSLAFVQIAVPAPTVATAIPATSERSPVDAPRVVRGALLELDGSPAAGASITVYALPQGVPADGLVVPTEIASGTTDETGRYSLSGKLRNAEAFRDAAGDVTLELHAEIDGEMVYASVMSTPGTGSDRAWTPDSVTRSAAAADGASRARVATTAMEPVVLKLGKGIVSLSKVPKATQRMLGLDPDTGTRGTASVAPAVESSDDGPVGAATSQRDVFGTAEAVGDPSARTTTAGDKPNCDIDEHPAWSITDRRELRKVGIGKLKTRKNSKQSFTLKHTENTRLEVAYFGARDYAGGRVGSTQDREVKWKWPVRSQRSKLLRLEWQYAQYRGVCVNKRTGVVRRTGAYKGAPFKQTGGSFYKSSQPSWTCNRSNSTMFAARTWLARSSNVFYAATFGLGGVSLGASQQTTTKHRIYVGRVKGRPAPRICGDSGFPMEANRLMEVSR